MYYGRVAYLGNPGIPMVGTEQGAILVKSKTLFGLKQQLTKGKNRLIKEHKNGWIDILGTYRIIGKRLKPYG